MERTGLVEFEEQLLDTQKDIGGFADTVFFIYLAVKHIIINPEGNHFQRSQ